MNYCIIDIETVNFKSGILEVAALKFNGDLEIIGELEVRTHIPWPENHVSGIKDVVVGKYSEEESLKILNNFIEGTFIIGWGIAFEMRILNSYGYVYNDYRDLMMYYKKKYKLQKYNLGEVSRLFGVKELPLHRALEDCVTIYDLLKKEMEFIRLH